MKTLKNVVVLSLEDYEQLMKNQKTEELEVGKWYFVDRNEGCEKRALVMYQGQGVETYGFSHAGLYVNGYGCFNTFCNPKYTYTKASPIEVFQSLKKHAISLGFEGDFSFSDSIPNEFKCDGEIIFKDGIWEKPKPKIDYSRLKTGSVVMLKYSGNHIQGITINDKNIKANIVLINSQYIIHNGILIKGVYDSQMTLERDGKFITFNTEKGMDFITEVISY